MPLLCGLKKKCRADGKVDIGADLIESPDQANATVVGYHGGPEMAITGRSADIRKPTKPNPIAVTNDRVTTRTL